MAGEGGMTVVLRTLRSDLIPEQVFGVTLSITILIMLLPSRSPGSSSPSHRRPHSAATA